MPSDDKTITAFGCARSVQIPMAEFNRLEKSHALYVELMCGFSAEKQLAHEVLKKLIRKAVEAARSNPHTSVESFLDKMILISDQEGSLKQMILEEQKLNTNS